MYYYSIFQQLFNFIPRYLFEKFVEELSGRYYQNALTQKKSDFCSDPTLEIDS